MIRAILFDLDGTLADTALDLGFVLNELLVRHGRSPLPHERIRPYASHGTQGLLAVGFGLAPADPEFAPLRQEYLELYEDNLCRLTRLFDGMMETLDALEARGLPWGVVTNKPARFTDPLMAALGLAQRASAIVSGDTCPQPKPHPGPLVHASETIKVSPEHCAYVGDAQRDMEAAIAAGMHPVLARYGYLGPDDHPEEWQARTSIDSPGELLRLL